jgi:hypothetical protein
MERMTQKIYQGKGINEKNGRIYNIWPFPQKLQLKTCRSLELFGGSQSTIAACLKFVFTFVIQIAIRLINLYVIKLHFFIIFLK